MLVCPKCGRDNAAAAVICSGCDYILDTSFLGRDILNEEAHDRELHIAQSSRELFGGDALILGELDRPEPYDPFMSENTGSFLTSDTQETLLFVVPAPVYVGGDVQAMLKPEVVLRQKPGSMGQRSVLSPFELFVLDLLDGRRSVARVRVKSRLSSADMRIALAMLAEKGLVEIAGVVRAPDLTELVGDDDDDESLLAHRMDEHASETHQSVRRVPGTHHSDLDELRELASDEYGGLPPPNADVSAVRHAAPARLATRPSSPGVGSGLGVGIGDDENELVRPALEVKPLQRTNTPRAFQAPRTQTPPPQPGPMPARHNRERDEARKRAAGFYELCMADIRAGRVARAYGYAKMALDADPEDPNLKALVFDWKDVVAAKQSSDDVAMFNEAVKAEEAGDYARAAQLLRKATELNPKAGPVFNRLGVVLATRLREFNEASNALLRAIELEPTNTTYKNNLGKIIALADDPAPEKEDVPAWKRLFRR